MEGAKITRRGDSIIVALSIMLDGRRSTPKRRKTPLTSTK